MSSIYGKKVIRTTGCYSIRLQWANCTLISVTNLLKDRISFPENQLSKKDTIIDYLSNELNTNQNKVNPRTVQIVVEVLIFMKV